MIPSDHFVRFYNEVFKFLHKQPGDELKSYWREISRHQEGHVLKEFKERGFPAMKEYWDRIFQEENCAGSTRYDEKCFVLEMDACASLKKAKDNDAGLMPLYCDHCAGWICPVMEKLGYFPVVDMISRNEPRCKLMVFKNREDAETAAKNVKLPAVW